MNKLTHESPLFFVCGVFFLSFISVSFCTAYLIYKGTNHTALTTRLYSIISINIYNLYIIYLYILIGVCVLQNTIEYTGIIIEDTRQPR